MTMNKQKMREALIAVAEAVRERCVGRFSGGDNELVRRDRVRQTLRNVDLTGIVEAVRTSADQQQGEPAPKLTTEMLRQRFEATCKSSTLYDFPLEAMNINGAFHHYMDTDTDSAFTGYRAGFRHGMRHAAPAGSVPEGYTLVPVAPTPEMIAAGKSSVAQLADHRVLKIWSAVIAAAPKPEGGAA